MTRFRLNLFAICAALALLIPTTAIAGDITSKVIEHADGTRTLVHEALIDAPAAAVWATLSTEEGWKLWGPRFANFDLRHGGTIETGYHEGAAAGDPNNIVHRIIAYVPGQLLVIQVIQAPENGPVDIEAVKNVWGVYEVESIGEEKTLLRVSGVGYARDQASSQILEFFKSGNVYSIELLKKNLAAQHRENKD